MSKILIPPQAERESWKCWTELRDGSLINLTGLSPEKAVQTLRDLGVTESNILYTTHIVTLNGPHQKALDSAV